MQRIYAVILAGGSGKRFGSDVPKQFMPVGGKPVIRWSIDTFLSLSVISEIIIVCPEVETERLLKLLAHYSGERPLSIVAGGSTRQESGYNALTSRQFKKTDIILFHDAARPFVTADQIENCIEEARNYGSSSLYVPATDTIAEIEKGFVKGIPPRKSLYYTQTPQCFRYMIIKMAHDRYLRSAQKEATDDVSLVLDIGYKVRMVEGDSSNMKITNPEDLEIAEALLNSGTIIP